MPKGLSLLVATIALVGILPVGARSGPTAPGARPIHVALQIRPGLWEYADTPKVTGDAIFPDAMLARVPPAQRAQFLAETRREVARPHKARECMTQPKFEQRVSLNFTGCARTIVSNTPRALEIRNVCRSETQGIRQDTLQKILVSSPTAVTIATHAISTRGGKTMTIDSTDVGRWISTACPLKGDVIQQLP